MIDLQAHFGRRRHAVGYDDLMRIMAADGIKVEPGDFARFPTGFDDVILEMKKIQTRIRSRASARGSTGLIRGCTSGSPSRSWWR